MTREKFDLLVRSIEKRMRKTSPQAAAGRGMQGDGRLCMVRGLDCARMVGGGESGGGGNRGRAGWFLFALCWALFVLVWEWLWYCGLLRVHLAPIEGRRVMQTEAPALFLALSDLRTKLRTIPFHHVLIVTDFNASVVQQPRLGVFGWWQNYLLLGMPLLESLPEEEFLAVLAHEFAHLSHQHGRLGHWLYRLRRAWEQIFASLQQEAGRGKFSLRALSAQFARWFWPRFNAYAFVLSRANEYEADHIAGTLAGAPPMMSALGRLAATREFMVENFWPGIRRLAAETPEPPADLIGHFCSAIRGEASAIEMKKNWGKELRALTTNADTHPCLNDRLKALGWDGRDFLSPLAGAAAAEVFLGKSLEAVRRDVNALWRKELSKTWSVHNAKAAVLQRRLDDLSCAGHGGDADTLWDRACMRMQLETTAQVEPLLREILAARHDHAGALMALGNSLLERNRTEGEIILDRAMAADEGRVPQACQYPAGLFPPHRKCGCHPQDHRPHGPIRPRPRRFAAGTQFRFRGRSCCPARPFRSPNWRRCARPWGNFPKSARRQPRQKGTEIFCEATLLSALHPAEEFMARAHRRGEGACHHFEADCHADIAGTGFDFRSAGEFFEDRAEALPDSGFQNRPANRQPVMSMQSP